MKRISIIMMALALIMGMSQCKKNEQTANNNNGEKPIITVSVANNSKLYFSDELMHGSLNTLPVFWDNGDVVYVVVNGKCLGYLVVEGETADYPEVGISYANFAGYTNTINVEGLHEGDVMELYLLGGNVQTITPVSEGVDYATISYADQSLMPTVISRGIVDEPYSVQTDHYMCYKFTNMNAVVKFSVVGANTSVPITICGVKNQSVVSFDGTIVNSDELGNIVTFRGASVNQNANNKVRYAVVPSNQGAASGEIIANGFTGTYEIPAGGGTNSFRKGTITLTPAK